MAAPHAVPIRLSTEDLIHFDEALKAHTTAQRDVLRIRIVLLAHQGFTNLEIAAFLGCDVTTVAKWRGRFAQSGRAGLVDQPRSGRPPHFSPLQQAQIISLLCQPEAGQPTLADTAHTAPLQTTEVVAPSPAPEATTFVSDTEMVAPAPDSEVILSAPGTEVAASSADLEAAVLASCTETEVAAPVPAQGAPGSFAQPNEAFAAAPPAALDQNVASVDARPCSGEIAPGTLGKAPTPTSSPADPPLAQGEPGANAPQGTKSLPQPKKKRHNSRAKSQAKHQRGNKQAPGHKTGQQAGTARSGKAKRSQKPCPEHQRFARTQRAADFDLSFGELRISRIDLAIVPVMETTNVAPDFPAMRVPDPVATSRMIAAALGLPEEGCLARVELPFVTATAQDLTCLMAGGAWPALPLGRATTPLDVAMLAAGFEASALPLVTTTAFFGLPLSNPSHKQVLGAKTGAIKRPLGCVLSLAQLLERLAEQLHLKCSRSTLSRLLAKHELKPWRYQYWIFPEAANFAERAGPILDLYAGYWQGEPLGCDEFVLSLDEKTSIQARRRLHETLPCGSGRPARVEWGYGRGGALQYLACWDVYRGKVFGRCEASVGIASFDRLVEEVMKQEPYASAKRVFAIMDNGSSHRGQKSIDRLEGRYPHLKVVHTPVHASWLNQVEIYFSIIERALLTPNDFQDLKHLEKSILAFQRGYNERATPFAWRFTRTKLAVLLKKLESHKRVAS